MNQNQTAKAKDKQKILKAVSHTKKNYILHIEKHE